MRLPSSGRLAAAVATAVLGATLTVSAPVHAEDQTTTDMRTDVRETDEDGSNQVRKRSDSKRDVVWAKASYDDNKVKLWLEVRELGDAGEYDMGWIIKDPASKWVVRWDHEESTPELTLAVFAGSEAPCANLRGERIPSQDRVKVVLPASCIGHPEWVKFGALAVHQIGDTNRYRADDVRRDNAVSPTFIRLGSRIHEN